MVVPGLCSVLSATTACAGTTVLRRYLCARELAEGALVRLLQPVVPPSTGSTRRFARDPKRPRRSWRSAHRKNSWRLAEHAGHATPHGLQHLLSHCC
ncbi:hypothetical protein ACFYX7_46900 [Streptomyces mirabilis]|uniref:hypothetical protein n=1 Tax=Streptomyces mirabilis TaxID=68239 RepID=UPI0036A3D841